jgi:hypothetical protein
MEFKYIVVYFLIRIRAHFIFVAEKNANYFLPRFCQASNMGLAT